jgi:hypothetical protein
MSTDKIPIRQLKNPDSADFGKYIKTNADTGVHEYSSGDSLWTLDADGTIYRNSIARINPSLNVGKDNFDLSDNYLQNIVISNKNSASFSDSSPGAYYRALRISINSYNNRIYFHGRSGNSAIYELFNVHNTYQWITFPKYPRIQWSSYLAPTVDNQLAPKKYVDDLVNTHKMIYPSDAGIVTFNGSAWGPSIPNGAGFLKNDGAGNYFYDNTAYLTEETDPTVPAHVKAITSGQITNWDTAYGWGNHAEAGYLTSFTETDPTVPAHVKAITSQQITNWDTAYGWGNHAEAGYLTSIPLATSSIRGGIQIGYDASSNLNRRPLELDEEKAYVRLTNTAIQYGYGNVSPNTVWAGPISGPDSGIPGFRYLAAADIPDLSGTYLTSFTETDPIFTAHAAYGITSGQIGNWDTAYGWGNHAEAGYLTTNVVDVLTTEGDLLVCKEVMGGGIEYSRLSPGAKGSILTARPAQEYGVAWRAVGDDGQVLTADSSQASGLKWADIQFSFSNIPNFYCTSWQEIKNTVTIINDSGLGGNIYVGGNILITESITFDLTNINFYGFNAHWRFVNSNDLEPSGKYTITVSHGNPTFHNINFWGTLTGSTSGHASANRTSRKLFILSNAGDQKISFNNCGFQDVVGGTGTERVVEVGNIAAHTSKIVELHSCLVFSRNKGNDFTYNGFRIGVSGTHNANGQLTVRVYNQLREIRENDTDRTSLAFYIEGGATPAGVLFYSDMSAWLNYLHANSTAANTVTQVKEETTIANDDLILFADVSNYNNIKAIKKSNF